MANTYSSPGVYIREVDNSWYEAPKTMSISVTVLGPAKSGPMDTPTDVETVKQFQETFGSPLGYGGLCACMCLDIASSVKFVRISDGNASSREVKIAGEKTVSVASAIRFVNAVAGTINEDTWVMAVSFVDGNHNAVNFRFTKGETVVYDSADEHPSEAILDGPFDPHQGSFVEDVLPAIATKCGFETPPETQTFGDLDADEYTFTAGGEGVKREVSISGTKNEAVPDVLTLTYNELGTIDNNPWEAEISNSDGDTFDLTIIKNGKTFYTSADGTGHGTLTFLEGPDIPNSVTKEGLIEGFTVTLDMGTATRIPDVVLPFTQGDNGWTNTSGEADPEDWDIDPVMQGLESISDREVVTTEIVAAPDLHSKAYNRRMADIGDSRKDVVLLLDIPRDLSEEDAVAHIRDLNTSYSAVYYPWVTVNNKFDNIDQLVPPSVAMLPAMMEEYLTYPRWTAPAGEPRLDLKNLISYGKVLNQASRDTLYQGGVNPLCNYRNLGNTAMGQKTLLREDKEGRTSALNRVNVRLLLNYIKVNVELLSSSYIFSNIEQVTMDSWILEVSKFLDSIKNQGGLYDYRVLMNWNTVTPENLNNNIMPGIIQVKPTRVAEFIPIDVVILNRDSEFTE